MGSRSFWLRILNVYPEEWGIVKRLYVFQFFQGAGIAFFFTSGFAQFLKKFPITELPWVMIFSASLLWITGLLYTKLEHKLKFATFNVMIILFMAGSMLLLWAVGSSVTQNWFYYLLLAWFNVLYLLNNMEFWGIAAILFDLRQSKRLFAVISAGDIPAKFIGYTLALIFVPYTGTQNLLLIGAVCMLASLPFFQSIVKSGKLNIPHANHKHDDKKHSPHKIRTLLVNIATNSYIRRIAFISMLTSTCVILVNYGFYGEVRKAYSDDVSLAKFIAFFYAGLRIVAFVTKMFFASRLTSSIGVRSAMFITPVGMLLLIALIMGIDWLSPGEKLIFYLFGICSIIIDVLRTSFNSPVLLTLMQPLPMHERLRAHTIVKGIMDPFASFLSGVFLLSLFYLHDRVDLMFLSYVLMVLGGLWVIGVILVNRQYLHILIRTIGSRYFSSEEFNLNNETVSAHIRKKLETGNDLEVISILRLLNNKVDPVADDLIAGLLHHPSEQVKLEAIRLIKNRHGDYVKEKLEALLQSDEPASIKMEAVKTLCKIGNNKWGLPAYLYNTVEEMRMAAITGMLSNQDEGIKKMAESALNRLLLSKESKDKKNAIAILNEVKDEYDSPEHIQLLKDSDPAIRDLATKAIGKSSRSETLVALFGDIGTNEKQVLASLYNAGAKAIHILKEQITGTAMQVVLQEKLITLCGKIGGDRAVQVLLELLKVQPQHTSTIIKALHRCRFIADADTQRQLEAIAGIYIINGVELLHMQQGLSKKDPKYDILNSSLQDEIQEIREILLSLFGCIYDREKINQVKYGLNTKHKESIANSMEIIELTVKKEIGKQFNTLFENTSIEQRCIALRALFTGKKFGRVEHILERILSEKPVIYYNWTKACSMYISKKYDHSLDRGMYKKYVDSDNKLLKETALFAVSTP